MKTNMTTNHKREIELFHYTGLPEQEETLEEALYQYNQQRNTGRISPELVLNLSRDMFTGFVIASEPEQNDLIAGLLVYETFTIQQLDEFESRLRIVETSILDENQRQFRQSLKSLDVFRTQHPSAVFPYITAMETFDHRQGIGKAIMETLQADPAISGIFLQSFASSRKFYEKTGFQNVGLYCGSKNSPYMAWLKNKPSTS